MLKSIKQINEQFKNTQPKNIQDTINFYTEDNRIGVKKIIEKYQNKQLKINKEILRIESMKKYENEAYDKGKKVIAGIDEVGRGCLAGPVVTAAVILPKDFDILWINDSKKLSINKRNELAILIKKNAIEIVINYEDNFIIDKINILNATKKSMLKNIKSLQNIPDYLILDAIELDTDIEYISVIKGDEKSVSVACASIIAKTERDKFMDNMHNIYPQYHFNKNRGYGVSEHTDAIKKYGICKLHRKTFIKKLLTIIKE